MGTKATLERFSENVEQCEELARQSDDANLRSRWLDMAEFWKRKAMASAENEDKRDTRNHSD